MMKETKNYPKANLQDYGYKDRTRVNKYFKRFSIGLSVVVVLMMYLSVVTIAFQSVNSSTDISSFEGFTLKWYFNMFSNRSLKNAIVNTITVSVIATLLATVLGTLVAVGINAIEKKKRQHIMILNNIPVLNADIVTGISLMLIFSMLLPLFPYLFGPATLILAHLFFTMPYVVLSVLPKLRETDKFLMDAALDLGIRPYRALYKVIVPAIKAGIFSGMLLAFTMSIDDFVISYYNTGNGFDNLSIWIYGSIGRRSLTPSVYAFSTMVTLFTVLSLIGYQYLKTRRVKNEKH
ncbi:MAG: ABC transporter permease [Paracholeplasma sp.]|uniref:Spermidine/putrescine-binding periplasmic protein n=1 Tax=Acholeplasma brassicae TaxID=61635 RepID=U4KPQ0_9MOLU|nr:MULTISPECIES: ABC transporter permease [Paracholeplasma]MDY3195376.1 ABC transporter permease [Paracholeplasma sp.]CCV66360.1 Spermidine/putrescine-binding periplasmic protein [Paracholeplasma brassicae]